MSAPTELDGQAIRRGLLVPRARTAGLALAVPTGAADRRSVDRLAAREQYGAGSVFELAEALYALVPRRLSPLVIQRDPWTHPVRRHLARGVLYALPTLPYLAALRVLDGEIRGVTTMLFGSVLALAVTYGVAHVGHLLIGYGAPAAAARLLRRALAVSVVAGPVVVLAAAAAGLAWAPLVVVLAQLIYVLAATVVMVFERDRLLLLSLVPGVAVSVLVLATGTPSASLHRVVAVGLVTCVLLAVGAAVRATAVETPAGTGQVCLERAAVLRVATHSAYGAMVAGLLMYAVLDALWRGGRPESGILVGVGMLPLVLSMGISEWQLHAFRSDSEQIQHSTHQFAAFRSRVRQSLCRRVVRYGVALAAGAVVVVATIWWVGDLDATLVWRVVGYCLLGLALFVASVLISCGMVKHAVAAVGAAVAVEVVLMVGWQHSLVALTIAQVVVFGVLLLALAAMADRTLRSPLSFR